MLILGPRYHCIASISPYGDLLLRPCIRNIICRFLGFARLSLEQDNPMAVAGITPTLTAVPLLVSGFWFPKHGMVGTP